ncbi:MAG: efflux RND transporter periplasmic adaptor subunit [Myxococcales bacterium]|nr:efflux RND transporter periplasmic adaptor subunit [Myxococcales bacterium]
MGTYLRSLLVILWAALLVACDSGKPAAPKEHAEEAGHEAEEAGHEAEGAEHAEHDEEGDEHAEGPPGVVRLEAEAVERAGIRTGTVERRSLGGGTAIPAEIEFDPSSLAHVGPLVPGRFVRVAVALGDRVEAGQLLAVVASSDVSTARARLGQSKARLAAAELALKRQQQLSSEGIGAQRTLIEAEAQVGELRADVEGLRRQLAVFGSGSAGELQLVSPITGVIVDLHATLGETAGADEAVFTITDPTKVWVRGNVPELEIDRVKVNTAAIVRTHAYPDMVLAGTVNYVAPSLDEKTRSLPIRVTLEAPDPRLRSGLYGSIELVGGARDERVLVVPIDAVATIDGQQVVFVPAGEPNSFRAQPIRLGRRAGGFYEVRDGLTEGAAVAFSGAFTLKSVLKSGELSEGHAH